MYIHIYIYIYIAHAWPLALTHDLACHDEMINDIQMYIYTYD